MSDKQEALRQLRERINAVDAELVRLLDERSRISVAVGELKSGDGREAFQPAREADLLRQLQSRMMGPTRPQHLRNIYREILSASKDLQGMGAVSYLGPAGSHTHQATLSLFGGSTSIEAAHSIDAVFRDVESGRSELGVVPVENSLEGVVAQTLDRLLNSSVRICSEVSQPISHHLLSSGALSEVGRVYSHPQAFGQCRTWLSQHLPGVEEQEVTSTAAAVQAALNEEGAAAIASEAASSLYGLPIRVRGIEDRAGNVTRFLVIGHSTPLPTGDDKTSVCFSLLDRAGVLHDALLPLKEESINMSMIQSRPVRDRNWEYVFFVDMLGHQDDGPMSRALEGLKGHCAHFKILGSYPRARPV
ncbi:MAG: prephenate dehydratase [Candidatus Methanomethylophilaceae archaeon]